MNTSQDKKISRNQKSFCPRSRMLVAKKGITSFFSQPQRIVIRRGGFLSHAAKVGLLAGSLSYFRRNSQGGRAVSCLRILRFAFILHSGSIDLGGPRESKKAIQRPYRLAWSRTPGFHPGNTGSNPVRVAFHHIPSASDSTCAPKSLCTRRLLSP